MSEYAQEGIETKVRPGAEILGNWPIKWEGGPLTRVERRALFCGVLTQQGEEPVPYIQRAIEFEVTNGRGYNPEPIPVIGVPDSSTY